MGMAAMDYCGAESFKILLRDNAPEFAGQGHVADFLHHVFRATGFERHLLYEIFVHHALTTVGIQHTGGQFHGLSYHKS